MGTVIRALCVAAILAARMACAQNGSLLIPGQPPSVPATPPQSSSSSGETHKTQPAGKYRGPYMSQSRLGMLIGFRVGYGMYKGQRAIRGLQPIFRTAHGIENGVSMGLVAETDTVVQAKDGYAVSAIDVQMGDCVEGFDLSFRQTAVTGSGLIAEEYVPGGNTYKSDWCGEKKALRDRVVVDSNGHQAIGVYGTVMGQISSLGLICFGPPPPGALPNDRLHSPLQGPTQETPPASFPPSLPTAPVPSAEDMHVGAELLQKCRDSLVFVDGDNGKGSGFICNLHSHKLLVTNAHVLAAVHAPSFRLLDGSSIKASQAAVAVDHDIAVMAVPGDAKAIDAMDSVDTNIAIGDRVVVLGNAEGAGVIKPLAGKIVGLGPNLVEIDAEFVPGNSGSPIIHEASGKVIGVATYLLRRQFDADGGKSVRTEVRRFGFRLDSVKKWEPISWPSFHAQAAQIAKIQNLTGDLVHFLEDAGSGKFHPELHQNPVIKPRIDGWIQVRNRKGVSQRDAGAADANLLSYMKVACRSDMAQVRPQLTYDYFLRKFDQEQKDRDELARIFGTIVTLVDR